MRYLPPISLILGLLLAAFSAVAPAPGEDAARAGGVPATETSAGGLPAAEPSRSAGSDGQPGTAAAGPPGAAPEKAGESAAPGPIKTLQMRLSGSSCTACLHELERKIKEMPGVVKARVELPVSARYYGAWEAAPAAAPEATVSFDGSRTSFAEIQALLKVQGYHPFKVVEKVWKEPRSQRRQPKLFH